MKATHMLFANFADSDDADDALTALEGMGYTRADISVIAREGTKVTEVDANGDSTAENVTEGAVGGAATGGVIGGVAGLLAGVGVFPALAGLLIGGPVAAALGLVGAAATTVSGVVTGAVAGGLIGALTGLGMSTEDAEYYETQIKGGDIVLGVPVTPDTEESVKSILQGEEEDEVRRIRKVNYEAAKA